MSNTMEFMTDKKAVEEDVRRKLLERVAEAESPDFADDASGYFYAKYLGLKRQKKGGQFQIIQVIRDGLPLSAGDTLAKHIGLSPKHLLTHYVGMSDSTLRRRRNDEQPLSCIESERLVRYAHLLSLATNLMDDDEDAARVWLSSPLPALAGATPLDVAVTETGARRVEELIVSLDYGMFS